MGATAMRLRRVTSLSVKLENNADMKHSFQPLNGMGAMSWIVGVGMVGRSQSVNEADREARRDI